ncbi:AHH domain-containing protein [Melittangium boletus]|uniref:AHH domain-containing protein n=1 Tax=Melittangium boletus TaxID=83453 RepID=UPI003DA6639F
MSKEQHSWDADNLPGKHMATRGDASTKKDAGACLNRHHGRRNRVTGFLTKSSCNHRWQAFRRALDEDKVKYNWPAYESIVDHVQKTQGGKTRRTIDLLSRTGKKIKRNRVPSKDAPLWDITAGGKNFQTRCTRPYWHEAHHIVPNGELQGAIAEAGENESLAPEYIGLIRAGLLDKKYNLNHMENMIILPMAKEVAYALGLPRHRVSAGERSHSAYSHQVRMELDKIFKPIQQSVKAHADPPPDYNACKKAIEALSGSFRDQIEAAGKAMKASEKWEDNALEDMWKDQDQDSNAPI